jgi:hypothetical protein
VGVAPSLHPPVAVLAGPGQVDRGPRAIAGRVTLFGVRRHLPVDLDVAPDQLVAEPLDRCRTVEVTAGSLGPTPGRWARVDPTGSEGPAQDVDSGPWQD